MAHFQCGQIGRFFKVLGSNIFIKLSQILGDLLGYFEKRHFKVKTAGPLFGQLWETVGLLFILTSGHTAHFQMAKSG